MRAGALLAFLNANSDYPLLGGYIMAACVLYGSQLWLLLVVLCLLVLLHVQERKWHPGPQIAVGECTCLPGMVVPGLGFLQHVVVGWRAAQLPALRLG